MPGTTTLAAEVTHISKHGFWLLLADEELLVPFDLFPWFRKGTIEQISDVQWPTPDHLYWPGFRSSTVRRVTMLISLSFGLKRAPTRGSFAAFDWAV
jgi:hypothetical protein